MNKKVGIIGGAGFIGSQITNVFLDNNFEVKVGTTNISMVEKYQHLMNLNSSHNLHISELDVTDKEVLRTLYLIVILSYTVELLSSLMWRILKLNYLTQRSRAQKISLK
jgi:dTDP-D-glucose 4,6-dehydratase